MLNTGFLPRAAAVATVAALAVAAAPASAAQDVRPYQLPGVDNTTEVFPIDDDRIQVAVDPVDVEAGTVGITIQNNTTETLTCEGRDGAAAGTVTPAAITARAVDFYEKYPNAEPADFEVGLTGKGLIAGSVNGLAPDLQFGLGSAAGLLPGSAAELYNSEWGALAEIGGQFSQARLAGQVGYTSSQVTLSPRQATPFTVSLEHTSRGERQEFQAGFFVTCLLDSQRYVFHGFEGETRPVIEAPDQGLGSLGSAGSIGADSLGS